MKCVWCGGKTKSKKFCSAECLRAAFDLRDRLQAQGADRTIDDAVKYHKKYKRELGEEKRTVKFVHYTSSAGRWEYI